MAKDLQIISPTRASVKLLKPNLIRKLADNATIDDETIKLWFGEPDRPTPDFIRESAKGAIDEGKTFYQPNLGLRALRETIAGYMSRMYSNDFSMNNIAVTGSGITALSLASQCIVNHGDHVVVQTPVWPNIHAITEILGAHTTRVHVEIKNNRWHLDLDRLFDAVRPDTKILLLNSPNNPTGWMMSDEDQQVVLDFCRKRGIWIIADEVYNRLVYDRKYAPSFANKVTENDRVIIVNSFSKSWAMTGWRMGWITAPSSLMPAFEMLTEFTNSCVFAPTQIAGIKAIEDGEDFILSSNLRYKAGRDYLVDRFEQLPEVICPISSATFYLFFKKEGITDSYQFAEKILKEANVGLAPGAAFGPEGEGFLRICYAAELQVLQNAFERMKAMFI